MIVIPESWLYVLFMYVIPIYLACMLLITIIFKYRVKLTIERNEITTVNEAYSYWLGSLNAILIAPISLIIMVIMILIKAFK